MILTYVLGGPEGHDPIPEPDLAKFGAFFEDRARRQVALTEVGPYQVSTIFLGIDHGFRADRPPVLFESATIDTRGGGVVVSRRYATWAQAIRSHEAIVDALAATLDEAIRDRADDHC